MKKSGNWYVIDYKTCSVRIIMMHRAALRKGTKSMLPYGKNVHQISSYVPMIERKLKIKVSGWFLLYLARDRPKCFAIVGKAMSAEDKRQSLSRVAYYDSVYDRVENCKSFSDVKWIIKNKPCKNREVYSEHFQGFKPCPLEAVCFDKARLLDVLKQSWESNNGR